MYEFFVGIVTSPFFNFVSLLIGAVIGYWLDLGKERILAHNIAADSFRRILDNGSLNQTEIDIFAQHLRPSRRRTFYHWIKEYKNGSAQIKDGDYGNPLYPKTRIANPQGVKNALEKLKDFTKHK